MTATKRLQRAINDLNALAHELNMTSYKRQALTDKLELHAAIRELHRAARTARLQFYAVEELDG